MLGVTVPCALNVSVAASLPTSCTPEPVKIVDLVGAVGGDADVHQLRQLRDVLVALIEQRRGGRIRRGAAERIGAAAGC